MQQNERGLKNLDEYYRALEALPPWLAGPLAQLPAQTAERVHEIRLRAGGGPCLTIDGRQQPLCRLPACPKELRQMALSQVQMEEILYGLCGGSVHTHQSELAEGYVTAPGGCRVGVGGRYFVHPEQGVVLQAVRSLDLRVARSRRVTLPVELGRALQGHFTGLLLVGEPDSGKTTLLREIACTLAARGRAVAVVDERRELFPETDEPGALPLDVLSGLPKERALQMALRTLAPQAIVLDELGGMGETEALEQGFFSGVDFVASLHAASLEDAARRPQVRFLRQREMVHVLVLLEGARAPGQIREVCFA